jgi:hypothetical protein
MSNCNSKPAKRTFDYPEKTKGGKLAQEIRAKANTLTEAEREQHFNRGMQIIYGGSAKQATGVRH